MREYSAICSKRKSTDESMLNTWYDSIKNYLAERNLVLVRFVAESKKKIWHSSVIYVNFYLYLMILNNNQIYSAILVSKDILIKVKLKLGASWSENGEILWIYSG